MQYTGYELLWLLFSYSFLGWAIETAVGSIKTKKFVNRGFFSGPVCFVYGISAVLMTVNLWELQDSWFFLFLGCLILGTLAEWITGKLLEKLNHHKWWDYSQKKWNFDGYICLEYSLLWGVLGLLALQYGNEFLVDLLEFLPKILGKVLIWCLVGISLADLTASLAAVFHLQKRMQTVCRWKHRLAVWTYQLGSWIVGHVSGRMVKAYPVITAEVKKEEKQGVFAEGCGLEKLFWLFVIGAFLGDIVETVFCRATAGVWMSRSSLVWGPFSIVWGLAIAAATALLYKDKDKPDRYLFFAGTFLGGAYEYACSVFTEIVFGKVFWDYSKIPFNLGGRINLLYCFFWGIAAVVWIKLLYPRLSGWIEKLPFRLGRGLTCILAVFMAANITVSVMALIRYDERTQGKEPEKAWERMIDAHFDDGRMERIYPSAISK